MTNMTTPRRGDWLQTYTGVQFYPLDPRPEEIDIRDIAHALAHQCRFAGHCRTFYSVAQHSVLVSERLTGPLALAGLLHDAAEAYLLDLPRPLKHLPEFAEYRAAEDWLQVMIYERFGVMDAVTADIFTADARLLATEARDLMAAPPAPWAEMPTPYPEHIEPWEPYDAEYQFMRRFKTLYPSHDLRGALAGGKLCDAPRYSSPRCWPCSAMPRRRWRHFTGKSGRWPVKATGGRG